MSINSRAAKRILQMDVPPYQHHWIVFITLISISLWHQTCTPDKAIANLSNTLLGDHQRQYHRNFLYQVNEWPNLEIYFISCSFYMDKSQTIKKCSHRYGWSCILIYLVKVTIDRHYFEKLGLFKSWAYNTVAYINEMDYCAIFIPKLSGYLELTVSLRFV